ncbi:hypothetical protein KFE96_08920 [Kordiimonas sp. SCSIO 12603]|uniref:hypothetical protein n=1 Tax=Kordiimonas sp. SCSIO 12603 TaxID=2829596 RepID=UPI002107C52D|nr:hypothetical protein [Kordiimonas sp. SCSIO 12603]UTW56990.1 hypothetical protein KFE96_08920 [Kordiimonas sp. SCSIO 12603]
MLGVIADWLATNRIILRRLYIVSVWSMALFVIGGVFIIIVMTVPEDEQGGFVVNWLAIVAPVLFFIVYPSYYKFVRRKLNKNNG